MTSFLTGLALNKAVIDAMIMDENFKTRIHIVDRKTGEILKQKFFYSLCFLILKAYLFFLNEFMHGSNLAFHLERVHHFNEEYVKFSSAQIILAIEFLQQNHSVLSTKILF